MPLPRNIVATHPTGGHEDFLAEQGNPDSRVGGSPRKRSRSAEAVRTPPLPPTTLACPYARLAFHSITPPFRTGTNCAVWPAKTCGPTPREAKPASSCCSESERPSCRCSEARPPLTETPKEGKRGHLRLSPRGARRGTSPGGRWSTRVGRARKTGRRVSVRRRGTTPSDFRASLSRKQGETMIFESLVLSICASRRLEYWRGGVDLISAVVVEISKSTRPPCVSFFHHHE